MRCAILALVTVGALMTVASGCGSTPNAGGGESTTTSAETPYPFHRVLVVVASQSKDIRREIELAFVDEMQSGESEGISSYLYGQQYGIAGDTKDTVTRLASHSQADAVLVVRGEIHDGHAGRTQDQTYFYIGPIASYAENQEGTMAMAVASNWAFHVVPGSETFDGVLEFDTTLYLPSGDHAPVYRSTRNFKFRIDPGERGQDVASLHARDIVDQLRKDGMIQ